MPLRLRLAPFGVSIVAVLVQGALARADEPPASPPAPASAPATGAEPVPSPPAPSPSPAAPSSAPRADNAGSGRVLKVPVSGKTVEVALGCEGRALVKAGSRAYVACGEDGVVVVELEGEGAPKVVERIPTDGDAVGVFVRNGKVWVERAKIEATPIARARGVADSAPGSADAPGDRDRPGSAEAGPTAPRREGASIVAPSRIVDVFDLGLRTRLFLTVDDLGFGMMNHVFAVRRFSAPIALRAEALPLALATGKAGAAGAAAAVAMVSVDTHVFELGLGIGGGTVPASVSYTSTSAGQGAQVSGSSTVVVPTLIRFGAYDGLSLTARTNLVVQSDRFRFGHVDIVAQVPVSDRAALLFHGEGGNMGTNSGGMAMRYRATETREAGAVFVTGGAGYALLQGGVTCESPTGYLYCRRTEYSGPALSLGIEIRL